MKINWHPFFDAPEKGATGVIDTPILGGKPEKADDDTALIDAALDGKYGKGKEKEEEILGDDEEKEEIEEEEVEEPEEELISEEDEELGDKEKEETELIEDNARGVDFKKIKEKFTDFAKTNEYRELRNAYHREGQYTSLFPTIEDAREAAENNETFEKLNQALVGNGDPSLLLQAVKQANPDSFKKVATNFLDAVNTLDNQAYIEAVSPLVRRMAKQIQVAGKKALSRDAESNEGKALIATARNIMQYFFDDAEEINKEEPKVDEKVTAKERELQERENAILHEKFQGAYDVCISSVERHLDKQILDGLDPDGKLNDFMRDTLLEKIKKDVYNQIGKDELHLKKMNSLWKRAEQSGFNRDSLSRIVSAYLERARPIIPTVRSKFRSIAIKGSSARSDEKQDQESIRIPNRGRSGRAPSNEGRVNIRAVDPRKVDYSKTSDSDIFEGRVKLKG